jgi:hypothetical protein
MKKIDISRFEKIPEELRKLKDLPDGTLIPDLIKLMQEFAYFCDRNSPSYARYEDGPLNCYKKEIVPHGYRAKMHCIVGNLYDKQRMPSRQISRLLGLKLEFEAMADDVEYILFKVKERI